jgi:hypothetical protein
MRKDLAMLLGLTSMMVSFNQNKSEFITDEPKRGHGVPDEKPEVIPNGCQKYTFYGYTVVALNKKSAKKKCAKLANKENIFICKGCGHELPEDYSMRTEGYCYMCDPNITTEELLSDEPIK